MTAPIVIIGGGPAGAAAAITLAAAGRAVIVLERQREAHDKVCGEFMSVGALAAATGLGLDLPAMGAVPVRRLTVSAGGRRAASALPFAAAGLSRRALDEALLLRAAGVGADVRRGVAVRGVTPGPGEIEVRTDAGPVRASRVILATGKHDLHGLAREAPRLDPPWTGVKIQLRLAHDLRDRIEVELFSGGYGGMQPIEGGRATLCLAGRGRDLAAAARGWPSLQQVLAARAPRLAALTACAEPCWPRPLAVSGVPYGFLHRAGPQDPAGIIRVGDQFAVIPSFCGDGMAIALTSGVEAARSLLAGAEPLDLHRSLHGRFAGPFRFAARLGAVTGTPLGRTLGVQAARHLPALLPALAARTRVAIPNQAGF